MPVFKRVRRSPSRTRVLSWVLATVGLLCLSALTTLDGRPAFGAEPDTAASVTPAKAGLREQLLAGVKAFNRGDFQAYLRDLAPNVGYNNLRVSRERLFELNRDLKRSFPNLRMRMPQLSLEVLDEREVAANLVAEFKGEVKNYEGSGLGATYLERAQTTAIYRKNGTHWQTDELQVDWNESFIEVGAPFGLMGFGNLPVELAVAEPYRARLWADTVSKSGVTVSYAYALVPLSAVMEAAGAEAAFAGLEFRTMPETGVDLALTGPGEVGSFAHLLVVNKTWNAGGQVVPLGQKIYTRLVRVNA